MTITFRPDGLPEPVVVAVQEGVTATLPGNFAPRGPQVTVQADWLGSRQPVDQLDPEARPILLPGAAKPQPPQPRYWATVSMRLAESQSEPNRLAIARLVPGSQKWEILPTQINSEAGLALAETERLGTFALIENEAFWDSSSSQIVAAAIGDEIIVDDLDLGFQHFTVGGGHWGPIPCGPGSCWAGHAYWTYNRSTANPGDLNQPVDWATWTPVLTQAGYYLVEVWIPASDATTTGAAYKIYHNGVIDTVSVNQAIVSGAWVPLMPFQFAANGNEYVYLDDVVPEKGEAQVHVGFDAVRFTYAGVDPPPFDPFDYYRRTYAYTLDKVGNRTQAIETRAAFNGRSTPVVLTHNYQYDALNRLTQARTDTPGSDTAYTFDTVGNRLDKNGTVLAPDPGRPKLPVSPRPEAVSSTYNAANQLTGVSDQSTVISLDYDRNGNRIRETEVDSKGKTLLTEYRYDYENRLIGVTKSKNNKLTMQATYTYDGYGRRVRKEVIYPHSRKSDQVITYLYDGLEIIGAQLQQGKSVKETYYYLAPSPITGLRRPLAMEQLNNGKRYWYQTDGLDSIVALTNETGNLVSPFLYDEYGQILAGDTDLQIFTYTAQDYDPETGLHHFYARYYDPARGVWLTQDPYRDRLAEPGTLQRYGYVAGNPVSWVDVYGFLWSDAKKWDDKPADIITLTPFLPNTCGSGRHYDTDPREGWYANLINYNEQQEACEKHDDTCDNIYRSTGKSCSSDFSDPDVMKAHAVLAIESPNPIMRSVFGLAVVAGGAIWVGEKIVEGARLG